MVDILGPTSMSCTITPTIYSLRIIVSGLGPLSKYPITANIISLKKSTIYHFHLGYGINSYWSEAYIHLSLQHQPLFTYCEKRVDGLLWTRSTSINISSVIMRGIVAGKTWPTSPTSVTNWYIVVGLLRPISTTFTTSTINWGRVAGIKRPISTTSLSRRHFHDFFFRTFIDVVTTTVRRMSGLTIPIVYTLIYPHIEYHFLLLPIS